MSFTNLRDIPGLEEFIQDKVAEFLGAAGYDDAENTFDMASVARSACVAQTITNGTTTSAPSQDAVFDALALKANGSATNGIVLDGLAAKPGTPPAAGFYHLYVKDDGKLYLQNSSDTETLVGGQTA